MTKQESHRVHQKTVAGTFPGTLWWKDDQCYRDASTRYTRGHVASEAPPQRVESPRGRSRMRRAHASAGPLRNLELSNDVKKVVYVQDLQEDTSKLNELTPADADDLYYAIVRQYSKGTFKDKDTYRGKGTYGSLAAFMANTMLVNVTKVAQLASRGEYLFRMWAETLGPRGAENRNQCLG